MTTFDSLSLYGHTVSRMRPRQLAGVLERSFRSRVLPRLPLDLDGHYEPPPSAIETVDLEVFESNAQRLRTAIDPTRRETLRDQALEAAGGDLTFLGRTMTLAEPANPDWQDVRLTTLPRLWQLQLYGFRPLEWAIRGISPGSSDAAAAIEIFDEWLRRWIDETHIEGPGYLRGRFTPYAVSLRLVTWARYLAWRSDDARTEWRPNTDFEASILRELYKNARFLSDHVEYGVGGNHLIENGTALVAAGRLFEESGWIDQGLEILEDASRTQFLEDGCHFERSPMYHVIVTTRYLTVADLLSGTQTGVPETIRETARSAVQYLHYLRPPDDRIPLLNDAVYGQALALTDVLRYADAVGVLADVPDSTPPSTASGYLWMANEDGRLLVDGGSVGPAHLPGHSHNDLLQFLLWVDGHRIVTDTGVFDYEPGPRRQHARSVRGHNTAQVDDVEPIRLGGRFLLGARTSPTTRVDSRSAVTRFEGTYEARPSRRRRYDHYRSVDVGDSWWAIWDVVRGHRPSPVSSRVHFHPDVTVRRSASTVIEIAVDETTVWLHPLGATATVSTAPYYPRFGEAMTRPVVRLDAPSTRDERVAYGAFISTTRYDTVDAQTASGTGALQRLVLDGTSDDLPVATLLDADG